MHSELKYWLRRSLSRRMNPAKHKVRLAKAKRKTSHVTLNLDKNWDEIWERYREEAEASPALAQQARSGAGIFSKPRIYFAGKTRRRRC